MLRLMETLNGAFFCENFQIKTTESLIWTARSKTFIPSFAGIDNFFADGGRKNWIVTQVAVILSEVETRLWKTKEVRSYEQ